MNVFVKIYLTGSALKLNLNSCRKENGNNLINKNDNAYMMPRVWASNKFMQMTIISMLEASCLCVIKLKSGPPHTCRKYLAVYFFLLDNANMWYVNYQIINLSNIRWQYIYTVPNIKYPKFYFRV